MFATFKRVGRDEKRKLHINLMDQDTSRNEDSSAMGTVESLFLNKQPSRTTENDSS